MLGVIILGFRIVCLLNINIHINFKFKHINISPNCWMHNGLPHMVIFSKAKKQADKAIMVNTM